MFSTLFFFFFFFKLWLFGPPDCLLFISQNCFAVLDFRKDIFCKRIGLQYSAPLTQLETASNYTKENLFFCLFCFLFSISIDPFILCFMMATFSAWHFENYGVLEGSCTYQEKKKSRKNKLFKCKTIQDKKHFHLNVQISIIVTDSYRT